MITPGQRMPIVIATKPVDFRRGHDGLAATVQRELGLDPHSGLTGIFRSKRGDRLKILVWDGTGLVSPQAHPVLDEELQPAQPDARTRRPAPVVTA